MDNRIENLKDPHSPDLLLNVAWAVSGLCRGKPHFSAIQPFALHLVNALVGLENSPMDTDKYRVDIVWALSYIAEDERGIETLINLGAAALFVNIIARAPKKCLLVPTVRAMGNLSVGSDSMTDRMLSAGYLEHVMALLNYPSVSSCVEKMRSIPVTMERQSHPLHAFRVTEKCSKRHLLDTVKYSCRKSSAYPDDDQPGAILWSVHKNCQACHK